MKKIIALCLVIILLFTLCLSSVSYADPMTLSQIASIGYAFGSSFGLDFGFDGMTSTGVNDYMSGMINTWLDGRSISEAFGVTPAQIIAGKLIVPHTIINGLINFYNSFIEKNNIDQEQKRISFSSGGYSYTFTGLETYLSPSGLENIRGVYEVSSPSGSSIVYAPLSTNLPKYTAEFLGFHTRGNNVIGTIRRYENGSFLYDVNTTLGTIGSTQQTVDASLTGAVPTVLNPDKEWSGTIGGEDWPDTNLDELLGSIDEMTLDGTLIVEGEIVDPIDPPVPTPTPVPIDPDTPLQDVPWEGLDTNLQSLYNQGLEEIGAIGDAQDAITDAIGVQTGALEGAIANNSGVVSGAIDQAVSDIQDAISEQTETLSESAAATAEATETIAEALEDETIDWQKFDLRGLFPFCIPFDIYNMLEALDASPTAPHIQLPFVIESIGFSYTFDLDFSTFDQVAVVMRQMELIVYGIALAWATSKVIKW